MEGQDASDLEGETSKLKYANKIPVIVRREPIDFENTHGEDDESDVESITEKTFWEKHFFNWSLD